MSSTSVVSPAPDLTPPTRRSRLLSALGLAWVLSRKNFQIRYKRAVLGVVWVVIQPAFQAAFLTFVFLKLFRVQTLPDYPLYVLSGILPWAFFSTSLMAATTSVVDNAGLVKKIALPLWVFPLSAVGGTAIAFSASLLLLVIGSVVAGLAGPGLLLLPLFFLLEFGLILGVALVTGAFYVAFRDLKYAIESLLLVGLYASPVLYELSFVPEGLRDILRANPMTGVMSLSRAAVMGRPIDGPAVLGSVATVLALLVVGMWLFRRRSREFADLL